MGEDRTSNGRKPEQGADTKLKNQACQAGPTQTSRPSTRNLHKQTAMLEAKSYLQAPVVAQGLLQYAGSHVQDLNIEELVFLLLRSCSNDRSFR